MSPEVNEARVRLSSLVEVLAENLGPTGAIDAVDGSWLLNELEAIESLLGAVDG